jgi:hypothetical protein
MGHARAVANRDPPRFLADFAGARLRGSLGTRPAIEVIAWRRPGAPLRSQIASPAPTSQRLGVTPLTPGRCFLQSPQRLGVSPLAPSRCTFARAGSASCASAHEAARVQRLRGRLPKRKFHGRIRTWNWTLRSALAGQPRPRSTLCRPTAGRAVVLVRAGRASPARLGALQEEDQDEAGQEQHRDASKAFVEAENQGLHADFELEHGFGHEVCGEGLLPE